MPEGLFLTKYKLLPQTETFGNKNVSERFSLFRRFKAIEIAVAPVVFACIMPVKGEMIISLS